MSPELGLRHEDGRDLAVLVWHFDAPARVISSAPYGGGIGLCSWVLNAQVSPDYDRVDPATHVHEIAAALSLDGHGTGMLTAVDPCLQQQANDGGAEVAVTVGLGQPTWAAAADEPTELVGTINVVAWIPAALSPAALVNAVTTVAEAKAQALFEAGVPGTGTASDAVVIACPDVGAAEAFAGPRSTWGARLARATHAAVLAGTR
jgi:adenosylcobinamide amidohydrolase